MIELQQNRYLWIHFAGLAFIPLLLDIGLAGLASAGPALPFHGQFWAIALFGITPALAMQWFKPFYIFSLPPSALKPSVLSEDQRRCLQIFKSWQIKALALLMAGFSLWLLDQIYVMLPQVSPMLTPRAGLVWGAIAFFTASTFMQISVSAGRALLISPTALKRVPAVDEDVIAKDFLILGIRLNQLLPARPVQSATEAAAAPGEAAQAVSAPMIEANLAPAPPAVSDDPLDSAGEPTVEVSGVEASAITEPMVVEPIVKESAKATESPSEDISPSEVIIPERLPPEEDLPA